MWKSQIPALYQSSLTVTRLVGGSCWVSCSGSSRRRVSWCFAPTLCVREITMRRPRVKLSRAPRRLDLDRVRIGGAVPGLAFDVADPDGWLW